MTDVREKLRELLLTAEKSCLSYGETADAILAAFPELSGWQDIATAQRDGTRIQGAAFDPAGHVWRQYVMFWNPGWAGVNGVSDAGPFWQAGGFLEHPTRWMPLPEPPT